MNGVEDERVVHQMIQGRFLYRTERYLVGPSLSLTGSSGVDTAIGVYEPGLTDAAIDRGSGHEVLAVNEALCERVKPFLEPAVTHARRAESVKFAVRSWRSAAMVASAPPRLCPVN